MSVWYCVEIENNAELGSSIIPLQFWDTPANFELENLDIPLSQFSTLVFVLDIQVRLPGRRRVHN